jgi:transitional endoplasmic reticulum ATPase
LPVPDAKTREKIFNVHTRNKALGEKVILSNLAEKTEGMVGADIEFICKKAAMLAIREFIETHEDTEIVKSEKIIIDEKHFEESINLVLKQNVVRR